MNGRADADRFSIDEVEKLGFLAIPFPGHTLGLDKPLRVTDGFWFVPKAPTLLESNWREAVGELAAEALDRAPFWIVTTRKAPPEGRGQSADDPMVATLHDFLFCLLMGGFPELGIVYPAQSFLGTLMRLNGKHHIATFRAGAAYPTCPNAKGIIVDLDGLRAAVRRLRLYDAACSGPSSRWFRVNRGLHMLFKAMHEYDAAFRLHHYVQSLEALLCFCKTRDEPRRRDNKRQFQRRCAPFTCESADRGTILGEIYDIRGNVEHMHAWTRDLTGKQGSPEDRATLRLWQVENLALHVYSRLLESEELLECFGDDRIGATWGSEPYALESLWTDELDLEKYEWQGKGADRTLGIRGYDPMRILIENEKEKWKASQFRGQSLPPI
jgi:hypothetical protein